MGIERPIIAINNYFSLDDLNNRIFAVERNSMKARSLQAFRHFMNTRGVEVVTLDVVDFRDPNVKAVIYFDCNWRLMLTDQFIRKIPYEKRSLVLLEPANINPSFYYTSFLRDRFNTIFTWDCDLLRDNPSYSKINVPVGAEPQNYRINPFKTLSFDEKRFLVAVSMNRWSYMPQSTYSLRKQAYNYFGRAYPDQFDLYGMGWNEPCVFYEKWLGYPRFSSWRGLIENTWDAKVQRIARYKFALCFENNASQPGYISEKITDCLCARCVPVYYGCKEAGDLIPRDAWIDFRRFSGFAELSCFLEGMDESHYVAYIEAIDRFMQSDKLSYFSMDHLFSVIADRLGFPSFSAQERKA